MWMDSTASSWRPTPEPAPCTVTYWTTGGRTSAAVRPPAPCFGSDRKATQCWHTHSVVLKSPLNGSVVRRIMFFLYNSHYLDITCLSLSPPQALCQDLICGDHEFCGGNAKGETACLCQAIFADPFRSTDSYGTTCSGPVKYTTTELTVDSVFIFI